MGCADTPCVSPRFDLGESGTWQQLKDQKLALDALEKAIKTGAVDGKLAILGELEAEKLGLTSQLHREREALDSFGFSLSTERSSRKRTF